MHRCTDSSTMCDNLTVVRFKNNGGIMADDADWAEEMAQRERDAALTRINPVLDPGKPGDCDLCGEWSGRLVRGACAPCRDKYLGGK